MCLDIEVEEANQLARELADLTGETVTGAITIALRERLERERRERSVVLEYSGCGRYAGDVPDCREMTDRPRFSTGTCSTVRTGCRIDSWYFRASCSTLR